MYTPHNNKCFKNIYKDMFCTQVQGELPNAATLHADANVEGYLDANLLGTNDVLDYGFGLDSNLANSAPPKPDSNIATSNLFESGNDLPVLPNSMQVSDASVVPLSEAAANNPVVPDFGNLLSGTNSDFSGGGNMAQGGTFSNPNTLPSAMIDTPIQEVVRIIPSGSDQPGGISFGNISPPDLANSFLQYVPDINVQAQGAWS